jgi:hypothetical protein
LVKGNFYVAEMVMFGEMLSRGFKDSRLKWRLELKIQDPSLSLFNLQLRN